VSTLLVRKIVCFVEDHKVRIDLPTLAKSIKKLISIYLRRADDQRGVAVLFPITRQDADVLGTEFE